MFVNPFDEAEPDDFDQTALLRLLSRSMMWEFIPPTTMKEEPQRFGQTPASNDVLKKEYEDFCKRRISLMPFDMTLTLLSAVAANAASTVLLEMNPGYKEMPEKEQEMFRLHNSHIANAVTRAVLGHLIQDGYLHYGGHQ